jgi:hypothetical protein
LWASFERGDVVVVVAEHVGDPAQQLNVSGRQRRTLVGDAKCGIRLSPRARAVRPATQLDVLA